MKQPSKVIRMPFGIFICRFIIMASLPYLLWEIYWAYKVGYGVVKWHLHITIYFYLWLLFYCLLYAYNRWRPLHNYIRFQLLLAATAGSLALAEAFLVLLGINQTAEESIGHSYLSNYSTKSDNYYHRRESKGTCFLKAPEFNYIRHSNSLGFSDKEWQLAKKKNEKRLLFSGDSFTEGDGAPYDSSYVFILSGILLSQDSNYTLLNAGVCGSDPFYNFVNYRDTLWAYQPGLIVQTLSSGDIIVDLALRGGMERFKPNRKLQFTAAPWWEPLYALSYISRLFFNKFGYNAVLVSKTITKEEKASLDAKVIALFKSYAVMAQQHNCKLLILLQPFIWEVLNNRYDYDLSDILNNLRGVENIYVFDLLPFYKSQMRLNHENIQSYYWPVNKHHNSAGYALMAHGAEAALDSFKLK